MDYTNFVKTYYAYVLKRLKEFQHYDGGFANMLSDWNIPKEFLYEFKGAENDFLPSEEVTINAPTVYMEEYLSYLGDMMPDLSELLLSRSGIKNLYSTFLNKNLDDEKMIERIKVYVDFAIEVKKRMGILR